MGKGGVSGKGRGEWEREGWVGKGGVSGEGRGEWEREG